jgi:glycosyltransferase involved in cell wall biosynthesis
MVRSEEQTLATCLQSAADLVDEVIVVDTGSTDGTRALAAKLGARVYEFPWVDDFAAARNECIRHARGQWIFWMDADEVVDDLNREKLRALFHQLPRHGDTETVRHGEEESQTSAETLTAHNSPLTNIAYVMKCLSVQPGQTKHGTVVDHVRVFRNRPDICWKYRVHEQILPALRATGAEVVFTDIVIQHTGYVDPAFTRQKLERNLRLLHLDHVDHLKDPYILFHLGWGHLELNRVPEAIAYLRASLDGSKPGDSIVKKLFALLAQAHHRIGQRKEALAASRAGRARNPEDAELLYLEGMFHRERGEYAQAIRCLQKLLPAPEIEHRTNRASGGNSPSVSSVASVLNGSTSPVKNQFGSADVGLNGYLARHQLALCYYQQGRWEEAEKEWKLALDDRPEYGDALKSLGEMYLKQGRWKEMEGVMEGLGGENTRNYEGQMLRARAMLARKEFEKARLVLEPMVATQPGSVYPRIILSHVYLQEGKDLQAAERVLREIAELDPTQAETWRNLAVLLRQQGRLDEAVRACHTGWRHCAHYATLPLLLGISHADQGNVSDAETCLLGVLELPYEGPMPDEHVEARHQLGLLYQKTGHPAEADAQWRTILAERPDYAPAVQALTNSPSSWFQFPAKGGGEGKNSDPLTMNGRAAEEPTTHHSPTHHSPTRELASIIILCCNQLDYTRQCLQSVLSCTRHPYELILVDNGSTDGTSGYFHEIAKAVGDKGLHSLPNRMEVILNETNRGYPAGCNQALGRTRDSTSSVDRRHYRNT